LQANSTKEDVWLAATEHHFLVNAARNLIGALDFEPRAKVDLGPMVLPNVPARALHELVDAVENGQCWPEGNRPPRTG
jgi:hypothetical protein